MIVDLVDFRAQGPAKVEHDLYVRDVRNILKRTGTVNHYGCGDDAQCGILTSAYVYITAERRAALDLIGIRF